MVDHFISDDEQYDAGGSMAGGGPRPRRPRRVLWNFGTISSGTHVPIDLLRNYTRYLERYVTSQGALIDLRRFLRRARPILADPGYKPRWNPDRDDAVEDLVIDAEDLIASFLPPYVRFGCAEGDGADFGIWPDWESLEQDGVQTFASSHMGMADSDDDTFLVRNAAGVFLYRRDGHRLTLLWELT